MEYEIKRQLMKVPHDQAAAISPPYIDLISLTSSMN